MSATEIILIVIGVAVFLLGYLMPARKKDIDEEVQLISEDEVRKLIAGEVEHVKDRIEDIIEETIDYSIEKAERAMERVTNEKIMAVNEYSDTVLEEINKNHKEVVFLYDMLNDKHDNLMSAINEATIAADDIKQNVKDVEITSNEASDKLEAVMQAIEEARETAVRVQEASQRAMHTVIQTVENVKRDLVTIRSAGTHREEVEEEVQRSKQDGDMIKIPESEPEEQFVSSDQEDVLEEEVWEETAEDEIDEPAAEVDFKPISPERVEIIHQPEGDYVAEDMDDMSTSEAFASMGIFGPKDEMSETSVKKSRVRKGFRKDRAQENVPAMDIQFAQGKDNGRNSNERILELHKAGKSNMAIARELGLGLGEVKLVIDLFEGM